MRLSNAIKTFFFIGLSLFICENLFAYSPTKHHRHMGVRAADESDLDRYLKNNLGFSKGINTTLTNPDEPAGEQTKTIKEWMGYGSVKEDDLIPRPPLLAPRVVAHFYDPVSNQGLHNIYINSLEFGESFESNLYSWSKAREYYYLALTSPTKEEREKYWALTFRSLGQVLHLVQDLASPAHVRNDNHLPIGDNADPYEDIWGTSSEGESFIKLIMLLGGLGNADYQYPVVELDRFEDYWDTESGQGLAEFTNSNFVSKDTNVDVLSGRHHYDNPQPTGLHNEPFEFTDSNNVRRTINVTYYKSNVVDNYAPGRSVNPFNYLTVVSFWNFYTGRYDPTRIHYTLNRKCHEEYAKLLVPRTVGYGAGLLNYFFRGKIDASFQLQLDEDNCNYIINITNKSNEAITGGNLEIYHYGDTGGGVIPVVDSTYSSLEGLQPDESCTATIRAYPGYAKYIIIFKGCTLGDEDNTTVAKVINQNIFFQYDSSTKAKKEVSDMRRGPWSINYNDVLSDYPYYWNTAPSLSIGQVYQTFTTGTWDHFERYIIYRSYPKFFTSSIPDEAEIRSVRYYMNIDAHSESLPWTLQIYKCNEATWGAGTDIIAAMPAVSLISQRIINITPSAINKEGITIFEMKCSTENAPFNGTQLEPNEEEVISTYNWGEPHYNYLLIDWTED